MQIKLLVACRKQQQSFALCARVEGMGECIVAEATDIGAVLRSAAATTRCSGAGGHAGGLAGGVRPRHSLIEQDGAGG
jgi:hypothetical protein